VIPPATDTPVVTPTPESSVVTATPETVVTPWQMVLTVATYVWLAGVALLAAYAVFTTLRLRRQVGEAAHIADNLWQCDHLRSPFILGLFRPRIYLPSDLSTVARDSVVAHEQAHLRRRDHWWKPLGFVLLMVYWFNPLMWVAYVFLCRDIEAACDESVVRNMNAADRRAYSEALLSCSAPRRLVSACPLAFGETAVKSRIKSVLSYKKPTIWIIVAALLVSTVAGVCLLTDPKSDDTDKPAVTDTDDDPDAEPQYAVFTHVQQPYAQVTLEIGGNRCTYTNSVLSSAMLLEGTYEMGEDTVTMTFPDDAMTLVFKGDLTGLTFCNADSRYQEEYLTFGGYTLPDGAVFERQEDDPAPDDGTTPPPSYPTAFNAQVTGTVLEWHKEEEYLLLKVNPQFSEELGETLKVYTQYAPAGCAPEVGARLRILYGGSVQEGTPNAIYAASLFEPTAYHLIKTGVDLYDNLLKEIADYCYGLAPSAKAPDCSYLIFNEHIDPMFAIGIKVMDLDKNGQNDLLVSAYNGLYGTRDYVYDAYTIKEGKLVHLLSGGERSRYYLHEDGYIEHQWAGGAALSGTDFYRLVDGSLTFVERVTYDADYAVESGLAADLPSVTGDMPWFHTTQIPGDNHKGYKHITEQQAKDIIADFTADHPLLNVNFLCLETGVAGSPDDDDSSNVTAPPTTSTTTKPTTTTTIPSTPSQPKIPEVGLTYVIRTGFSSSDEGKEFFGTSSVKRFDSRADFVTFLTRYQKTERNYNRWEISDFDQFDIDFFTDNVLLMTRYTLGSGSITPQIGGYTYSEDGKTLLVGVDELHPSMGTDDVGFWLLFSGIKKSDLQGVTEWKAYQRKEIPTDSYMAAFTTLTAPPETGVEKWRTWFPHVSGHSYGWDWDMMLTRMDEGNRWVSASSMGGTYQYMGVFQKNGHIHYVSSDYTVLLRDDGKMIRLNQNEINLLQCMYILRAEDDPNTYFIQSTHPGMDPEYLSTPKVINSPELRAIAQRESWFKNNSTHTFEALFIVDGKMYYVDWDKEQILYYQEDVGYKVLFLTKEEQTYLSTLICDPTLTCSAQIKGTVVSCAPQLDYLIMRTEAGKEIQVSLLYWEDKAFDIGTQITVGYDGYTKEGTYPTIYARSIVKKTWASP
jgi:beta-lactamase regulating signal transducer with metallopeptidase domain